jgi:hypothetical protein
MQRVGTTLHLLPQLRSTPQQAAALLRKHAEQSAEPA